MITLDDRAGSGDLAAGLRKRGISVKLARMSYGDAAWDGEREGEPVRVGVEIKKVPDALQCLQDGRFAGHQLPGMMKVYDVRWLLVEGPIRAGQSGELQLGSEHSHRGQSTIKWSTYGVTVRGRGMMLRDFRHWLSTLQYRAGIRVAHTLSRQDTSDWLAAEHGWWQAPWEQHKSHLVMYAGRDIPVGDEGDGVMERFFKQRETTEVAKWALCGEGLGSDRARKAGKHFHSVIEMINAPVEEWVKVPGVGKTIAERVHAQIRRVRK